MDIDELAKDRREQWLPRLRQIFDEPGSSDTLGRRRGERLLILVHHGGLNSLLVV